MAAAVEMSSVVVMPVLACLLRRLLVYCMCRFEACMHVGCVPVCAFACGCWCSGNVPELMMCWHLQLRWLCGLDAFVYAV